MRATTSLTRYKNNARCHTPKQVLKLSEQMKANGWTAPILVDEDGLVLAGHGRLLAAERLGLEQVPVVVLNGLNRAQERAGMGADHRLHDESSFDKRLLKLEL